MNCSYRLFNISRRVNEAVVLKCLERDAGYTIRDVQLCKWLWL